MDATVGLAIATIVIVLVFDYTNGFHDASNIVATVIASRAMTPIQAVILVAIFEFLGPLLGGTAVADTIGKFIDLGDLAAATSLSIILCGVFGAIAWNLGTWWFGMPSSSSHALVGGLVGPVVVSAGPGHVVWGFGELLFHGHVTGVTKVLLALVLSPIIGFWVGFVIHRLAGLLLRGAKPSLNRYLRRAQICAPDIGYESSGGKAGCAHCKPGRAMPAIRSSGRIAGHRYRAPSPPTAAVRRRCRRPLRR